jgi:Zn-dependent protease
MRVGDGYLVLGRWGGAPVRAHWTLPIGAFVFGQARIAPGFWLGFFLVIFIHELGHAILVRRSGCRVVSIDVHGMGGVCRWEGAASPVARAEIACGGVAAQLVALVAAIAALTFFGQPSTAFTGELAQAFTNANVWMMALNLIPVPPLDGAEAWKLIPLARARRRRWAKEQARASAQTSLQRELEALAASDREPPSPEAKEAVDALFRKIHGKGGRRPDR